MLTLPSEPLPQIVLSMDGDPPFCSAPPHSDPLPLPTVTPSCASYGLSGDRRSSRLHDSPQRSCFTERRAAQKPYDRPDPSSTTREQPAHNMVSQSIPPRAERAPEKDMLHQEGLDFSVASESVSDNPRLTRPGTSSLERPHIFPKPTASNALETCSLLAPGSAPKGWVIGPIFQSFKSKMASFTEIVMSPVKLFKASSEDQTESEEPSQNLEEEEETTQADLQSDLQQFSLKVVNNSLYEDNNDNSNLVVPSNTPKPEPESTVIQSASNSSQLFKVTEEEGVFWSARTRLRSSKATPKAAPLTDDRDYELTQDCISNMEANQIRLMTPEMEIKPEESEHCVKKRPEETQVDRTPTSRAILDDDSLKKVKRTLNLSGQPGDTGKRKKTATKTEEEPLRVKKKPNCKEEKEETQSTVRKAVTRANKKLKAEQEGVLILNNNSNMCTILPNVVNKSKEDQGNTKAKAKTTKRTKRKVEARADLQTVSKMTSKNENELPPLLSLNARRNDKSVSKKRKAKDQLSTGADKKAVEDAVKLGRKPKKTKVVGEAVGNKGSDKNLTEAIYLEDVPRRSRDEGDLFGQGSSTRLLRSYSCPEIPVLRLHDTTPWTPHFHSPPRSRSQPSQHHNPHLLLPSSSFRRSARRARRHTVCSLEVEREIAPLCLRKEVYPARRSPARPLSPRASIAERATCFLSSPLAFLSQKPEGPGRTSPSPAASPFLTSLLGTSLGQLPGFHLRTDTLLNTCSDSSGSSVSALVSEPHPQSEEDDEDTSSSSQESEDLGMREEKALSDSEVKVVKKDEGQRKVSSIKIRKALPKPQNNLTPMGLPKQVRVKKKEFSLEEIYTNKNFRKPPESRLETIFEVPLSRKNGSETWFGLRRTKRFLEFLEVGEARKPKKPLVGATKAQAASSRTRRGNREDPALVPLDLDSMLCAKLEQLGAWLSDHDRRHS